ncbi:MAG: hypothetical protein GF411_10995 [Candidatus Lokiarchaeota archaeon]|nr:hypothetical protein [Candidatus Lokiarchaeota archaeon]
MDRDKIGSILYILMYIIALGFLTIEVFRLYGVIDQTFVETMMANLAANDIISFVAIIVVPIVFFLWFFRFAYSVAPPEAKRQLFFCFIPLVIFLLVGFFAILAIMYMAVTFIGIYLTGVGTGISGYEDGKQTTGITSIIVPVIAIVGIILEMVNQGWFDIIIPVLSQSLTLPWPSQASSPSPSGYGIGYYISMISILYSIVKTTRTSWALRTDLVGSDFTDGNAGTLSMLLNPLFMIFWVLTVVFLFPLLPFIYLYWGLMILYVLAWITGKAGLVS